MRGLAWPEACEKVGRARASLRHVRLRQTYLRRAPPNGKGNGRLGLEAENADPRLGVGTPRVLTCPAPGAGQAELRVCGDIVDAGRVRFAQPAPPYGKGYGNGDLCQAELRVCE